MLMSACLFVCTCLSVCVLLVILQGLEVFYRAQRSFHLAEFFATTQQVGRTRPL